MPKQDQLIPLDDPFLHSVAGLYVSVTKQRLNMSAPTRLRLAMVQEAMDPVTQVLSAVWTSIRLS